MTQEEALCQYLKEGCFKDFMDAWRSQYERLGRCGGTISVSLNDQTKEDISGLMGKDYHGQTHAKIAYATLKKAIAESRFVGADFQKVIPLYYGEEILTRKTRQELKDAAIAEMFSHVIQTDTKSGEWFAKMIADHNRTYVRIIQEFTLHPKQCEKQLLAVAKAIDTLPMWNLKKQSLALFSSKISSDPHAFDKDTFCFYLLFQAICYFLHIDDPVKGVEYREVLYRAGLFQDSVNNFCCLARLSAYDHKGNLHGGWEGFYNQYEAFNVHIDNLLHVQSIALHAIKRVYVVENPSVFQAMLQHGRKHHYQKSAYVCTYGQLNYAGYLLLDLIHNSGIVMYYSGDMDAEGLLIADKLKQRYQDGLSLWRYRDEDYFVSRSDRFLSKQQKKELAQLRDPVLQTIGSYLLEETCGYQENLISFYLQDLDAFERT